MKLSDYIKAISDIESGTIRGHRKDKEFDSAVQRLASLGWALPGDLSLEQIERLAEDKISDNCIDELLIKYYSGDEFARLNSLVNNADVPEYLDLHKEILEEIFDSLRNERYRICIPALITILEGVLASKLGLRETRKTKMIAPTKKKIDDVKMNFNKTFWRSIHTLIDNLYKRSNFDEDMPKKLNRHWVLHGRGGIVESRKNSVQLLVLIGAIIAA